jgi:glycosyltransferase involved in cell wall biosynthesis
MTAAEAVRLGTPIIALGRGGAVEIIREGLTGELFGAPTPEVLAEAVHRFLDRESASYVIDPDVDTRFTEEHFLSVMSDLVNRKSDNPIQ